MTPLTANDPVSVGSFRLLGVLGSGGMGRVYLGESPTGRRVAIKVIRPDLAEDPAFRTRFQREVTAARTVSPLYTAAVVDADTAATSPWFATAYIDGPSLLSLIEANGPLAAGAVLTLAAGLAEALASIHGAGLVHRDLAPGNIILDDSGPHIIDFGIALAAQATKLTGDQRLLGTPSYIAPEVIEGKEAAPPSDIFSLGAILAFAVAAKHLVHEGPMHAQILQITRGRFDLTAVPKEIRPLIVRCTAVNPSNRPTAVELVRILVGAGVTRPSPGWFTSRAAAPSIKLPAPRSRVSRRRLLVTAGTAGLAAAAAGAAAWAGVFTRGPGPNAQPNLLSTGAPTSPTPRTPEPTRTGPGTIAWRARSGLMPAGLSTSAPPSPTRIIVDGERLIGANPSTVFAVGLDGEQVWTRTLPTGPVSLWRWGDGVLVADSRRLWLIDAANGEIRFAVNAVDDERADSVGDNPDGIPIQITGVALSPDTAFVGLNTATIAFGRAGERLWRRPRPDPRNGVRPPEGPPIAVRDRWLVTHDASGPVVFLGLRDTADGALQWLAQYEAAPDGPPPGGPDGHGGPEDEAWSRSEGRIADNYAVIREQQEVRVVALANGETVWSGTSQTPIAGIELVGGTILVAADRLRAYDLETQAQLWEQNARGARIAVTPSATSAFVASSEGLSLVDVDGRRLWSEPYPTYLQSAVPRWAGVAGELGYVTFRSKPERQEPLDFDVIAVNLGPSP